MLLWALFSMKEKRRSRQRYPCAPSLIQTEAGIGYRLMVEGDTAP